VVARKGEGGVPPARFAILIPDHEGASMSTEPQPGAVPEDQRIRYHDPVLLTVDGERFRVAARVESPGTYDFDWLTGPHEYGFGLSRADGHVMSRAEMEQAIREFLGQVDPATGYLAE
jgi:hypothetical protein